jgi:hypothetical protein
MSKRKKAILFVVMTMLLMTAATIVVSANPPANAPPDMQATMKEGLDNLISQLFGILGIAVPVVLSFIGAKIAITKGISLFKSLTGRAG